MSPRLGRTPEIDGLTIEKFMEKVVPEPNSGCWLHEGSPLGDPNGYAQFAWRYRNYGAHRVAYALFRGPIPQGLTIDHLCGVKCCVNPAHLDLVTQAENSRRYNAKRQRTDEPKHYGTVWWWRSRPYTPKGNRRMSRNAIIGILMRSDDYGVAGNVVYLRWATGKARIPGAAAAYLRLRLDLEKLTKGSRR